MPVPGNRLADETSPYLQQHAGNPVHWQPWDGAALRTAREEDRPILLSIGYSACHWCHVMAHESFEDEATADLMNELFVNIKVDREERPDLDRIYQSTHALLTQRPGGWPLTMFLSPEDQTPFFGGTYFPDRPVHGLPAFRDLLVQVEKWFRQHRREIHEQNVRVVEALEGMDEAVRGEVDASAATENARKQMEGSFDPVNGGFGGAPKFPHPGNLEFLLRFWHEHRSDARALEIVGFTLGKMARGGIQDHLGGGFCRYSVDDLWMIPHFEKMLYDNGQLLALCADAFAATGDPVLRQTVRDTAAFTIREMQSPEGGYYSSLDADSEGEEGKYYVWDRDEVRSATGDGYALFTRRFGLDRPPNFEGRWHLQIHREISTLSSESGMPAGEVTAQLDRARASLLAWREERVRPERDEKVLTSWNALMIRGMAIAARRLGNREYAESATRALDFVRGRMWRDGRLLATSKDGRTHLNAYLDDYAFLIDAVIELLQAEWNAAHLAFAIDLADAMLSRFENPETGGFFFTSHDHETLLQRPRPVADESVPAGNAVAAFALNRLGLLLGQSGYLATAERTVAYARPRVAAAPQVHAWMLIAEQEQAKPPSIVVLRGSRKDMQRWHTRISERYLPNVLLFAVPDSEDHLHPSLASKAAQKTVVAYHCIGTVCSAPISELGDLLGTLDPDVPRRDTSSPGTAG